LKKTIGLGGKKLGYIEVLHSRWKESKVELITPSTLLNNSAYVVTTKGYTPVFPDYLNNVYCQNLNFLNNRQRCNDARYKEMDMREKELEKSGAIDKFELVKKILKSGLTVDGSVFKKINDDNYQKIIHEEKVKEKEAEKRKIQEEKEAEKRKIQEEKNQKLFGGLK